MTNKVKYRFTLTYQTKYFKRASELMKKLDLDIGEMGIEETFEFKCDEKPIDIIKGNLKNSFECAEMTILEIEGGKIE